MFTMLTSLYMFAVPDLSMAPKDPRIELSMVENVLKPVSNPPHMLQ